MLYITLINSDTDNFTLAKERIKETNALFCNYRIQGTSY